MKRICISTSGVITISWYPYSDTCSHVEKVLLYARTDAFSGYKLIDSIKGYNLDDYVFVKGINYSRGSFFLDYICDCPAKSDKYSDTLLVDIKPPPVTEPDSVSVLGNGTIIVGWSTTPASAYRDCKSVIVYAVTNGNFPVDTIPVKVAHSGIDKKANGNAKSYSYRISPVDSCDNVSPLGNEHSTVFLTGGQDSCKYTVTLNWQGYKGWAAGVRDYEVYYSLDSAKGYTYAGLSSGSSFTFYELLNFRRYYFFVRAVKNSDARITSSSNRISLTTAFQHPFQYVYIKTVSVEGDAIRIDWTTNDNSIVGRSELYRGRNVGSMKKIAELSGASLLNGQFSYVDRGVDPSSEVWYYQVKVYNTCGHYAGASNTPHNILLSMKKQGRNKDLYWNGYDTWQGGVYIYNINRIKQTGIYSIDNIGTVDGSEHRFLDTDSFSDYGRPGICYQVVGMEGTGNPYGFMEQSYSNIVCYIDPQVVYIPNAFVPDEGVNRVFKPVITYADTSQSDLMIYNRWGELIYESNKINEGWDGKTKDGKYAPSGVYMYYIKVLGLDNSLHTYKGSFSLL